MVCYGDWFVDVNRTKTTHDIDIFIYGNDAFVLKPESKYWNTIKKNTPGIFWTRLESWATPGVPDCYGCKDGVMFWVELKITKDKKIKLSPFKKRGILTMQGKVVEVLLWPTTSETVYPVSSRAPLPWAYPHCPLTMLS